MARLNRILLLAIAAACLPGIAWGELPKGTEAQYLQEFAAKPKESAKALGALRSVRGLQAIIASGNPRLVYDYEKGMLDRRFSEYAEQRKPMAPDFEKILVERFDDPVWGKVLLRFVYWEKYRGRALFDLLYAHIADPQKFDDNNHWYRLIGNTDQPGIDEPLLRAVPKLSPDGQRTILVVLAERKYAPAVPAMARFMREHRSDPPGHTKAIYEGLTRIANAEAVGLLTLELGRFAGPLEGDAGERLQAVIVALTALPKTAPLDVPKTWTAIPHKDDPAIGAACVSFAKAHPHPLESPMLIARLGDMKTWQPAFEALMGIESADVWRDTSAKIDALRQAGTLPEGNYRFAKNQLSQRLDRPAEYRAQQDMRSLNSGIEAEATPIKRKYGERSILAARDPAAYVPYATKYVAELQAVADKYPKANYAVGLRSEIRNERMQIARAQRFSLGQPREALTTQLALLAMPDDEGGNSLAALQAAEISRYELNDRAAAIRYYEKANEIIGASKQTANNAQQIGSSFRTWIGYEIDYLKTGRPFTGRVTRDDLAAIGLLSMMGGNAAGVRFGNPYSDTPPTAQEIAESLDRSKRQPPSYEQLGAAAMYLGRFPSAAALLAFLERNDPARYLSASLLAMYEYARSQSGGMQAEMFSSGPALQEAIAQFKQKTGTTFGMAADARMATPEKTWDLFLASLRKGDRATATACYTGQLKTVLTQLFAKMSNAELAKMADDFSGLRADKNLDGQFREYAITRRGSPNNSASFVQFVNLGGEWLIQSM